MRKHPDARCEDCSLQRRPFVEDKLGRDSAVMFVGEAPSKSDVEAHKPFSGASGKLLGTVLDIYDIDSRDVYMTNAVACAPLGKETISKNDLACCAPRLHSTIQKLKPRRVVTFGATATKAVLQSSTGVLDARIGPPKPYPYNKNIEVIPTISPAFVLRSADKFPMLLRDVGKINDTSSAVWRAPDWKVIDDDSDDSLEQIRAIYRNGDTVIIDIEVGVEKDELGTHPERYDFLCIGIGYGNNQVLVIGEQALKSPAVQYEFKRLLESCDIVCHNGKFDIAALRRFTPRVSLFGDTMLASYCLDERTGVHSLGFLSRELLGAPDWKDVTKEYTKGGKSYANIPRPILYQYNAYDVGCTMALWHLFSDKLTKQNLWTLHDFLVESAEAIMELELDGMLVDQDYLAKLDSELQEEGETLETIFAAHYGLANPRSPMQVQAWLQKNQCYVASTNEATLTEEFGRRMRLTGQQAVAQLETPAFAVKYKDEVCQFIHALLEYRGLAKLWGTYVDGIGRRLYNGRIYPNLSLHTTVTGRLSSKDPNMQNIPRGGTIKRLFIPAPGYSYVQCDYRAAELRVVGSLSRCAYLRDVLNDPNGDIHGDVARQYYGPGYTSEQRTNCKRVVFGSTYGAEAPRVSEILGVSILEARKFLERFFGLMPEVVEWRADLKEQILAGEDLVTFTGRRRRMRLITNLNRNDLVKEGYAMIPQSTASDINLSASNILRRSGFATRMLVHDSILVECPTDQTNDVMHEMQRVMQDVAKQEFDDFINFTTEGEVGQSWAMK
jgi:uracil-DNA glycosylase family 4